MTFYIDPKISMLSTVPPGPPAAVTMATFDGTPAAGVVMSNGNLTVTHGTTNNGTGVKSLATKYTGKYFFEIKLTVSTTNANGGGIVPSPGGAFSDAVNFAGGFGASYGSGSSLIYTDGVNTTKNLGVPRSATCSATRSISAPDLDGFAVILACGIMMPPPIRLPALAASLFRLVRWHRLSVLPTAQPQTC